MNELVREIEEDIRRERFDRLWHSFGKVMVGLSIAVILGTIGVVIMQDQKRSRAMESTTQLIKGIDRINIEDYKGAIPVFDALASDPSSSYYGLSMLRKAQAQDALGDREGVTKTYRQLAGNDSVFGDLAKLLLPQDDSKAIETSRDAPFYFSHSEAKGWQLMRQGRKDEAVTLFMALYQDKEAPSSMRERLSEVLQRLAPDTFSEKTKLKVKDNE